MNEKPFGTYPDMLDSYEAAIKKQQPKGPYAFLGYSFGGYTAFEMTKRFEAVGDEIAFLGVIDSPLRVTETTKEAAYRTMLVDLLPTLVGWSVQRAAKFAISTATVNTRISSWTRKLSYGTRPTNNQHRLTLIESIPLFSSS